MKKTITIISLSALSAFLPAELSAKNPAADKGNEYGDSIVNLKEIAITATKSTSDQEKEAVSVSSLSRQTVERMNIVTAKGAAAVVPNLYIPDYGSRITSTIYVRGIGARIDQPAVGMNIDNVPIMNKDNYDFDILDIAAIDITRGPQSTLYGRNTMGGMIDIRTLSPLSYSGTRLLAEYGNANRVKAGVSHYARPTSKFGVGASLYYSRSDGFFENAYNGADCGKEDGGRASLKLAWKPNENFIVENMASFSAVRQSGYAYEFIETGQISYNDTCYYRRNSILDGLTMKWNHDNFSLTSVTSYQYIDDDMTLDQDFLPVSYFTLSQLKKEHAVTQDLVLKSSVNDRLNWLAGISGFYRHLSMDAPVTFKEYGIEQLITKNWNANNSKYPMRWDEDQFVLGSRFKMPSYGLSAYGEVSYQLDRLTFIGGVRFDFESVTLNYNSDCSTSYTIYQQQPDGSERPFRRDPVEIHNTGHLRRSFKEVLPKVSVVYNLPLQEPANLYLTVAKGYKAGGFNTQMFSDVLQQQLMSDMGIGQRYDVDKVIGYNPEKSWNYEIGGKFSLADGRLSTSFAAFYIDCRDQQLTVFPDGDVTGRIMTNAGKTRSTGAELSVTYYPVNGLVLNAGYGYTNAKFVEFNNGKQDYSGKFVPYAPQNTIFAGANYSFRVKNDFLRYISVGASGHGVGKIYWNENNTRQQNLYFLLDANVRFSGEHYSLDLWTKNATDTQYNTFYFVSIQHEFLQRSKPAQFGATLRITI